MNVIDLEHYALKLKLSNIYKISFTPRNRKSSRYRNKTLTIRTYNFYTAIKYFYRITRYEKNIKHG